MDVREKLMRLLSNTLLRCKTTEEIADYLIDNGITLEKATNAPTKWISVEERLPEPGTMVLVYSRLGCTYFSHRLHYHIEGRPFAIEDSGGWEVTHWMPWPEPPKENNNA